MISPLTRRLTTLAGVLFLALGATMFVAPNWAARRFVWDVSPFVAMTMGAWLLGTGVLGLECVQIRQFARNSRMSAPHGAARSFSQKFLAEAIGPWYIGRGVFAVERVRIRRFARIYAALLYFWLFDLLQSIVVMVHGRDLELGRALAWPYLLSLAAGLLATVAGITDFLRTRPSLHAPGAGNPIIFRLLSAAFVIATAGPALALVDGSDSQRIWPVALTLPSARAFAASFGALAVAAVAATLTNDFATVLMFLRAVLLLDAVVLIAALVFLEAFDFGTHPGQVLYIGLYVVGVAGTATMVAFARWATNPRRVRSAEPPTGRASAPPVPTRRG